MSDIFKYYRGFLSSDESSELFDYLRTNVNWVSGKVKIYGKEFTIPRLQAYYADEGCEYGYSGKSLVREDWNNEMLSLKQKIEAFTNTCYNSVLLNYYRDGNDSNGWHRDNEKELGSDPVIASISLGGTRKFRVRNRITKRVLDFELEEGSVIWMGPGSQIEWEHCIPKTKKIVEPRINLTFRQIKKES